MKLNARDVIIDALDNAGFYINPSAAEVLDQLAEHLNEDPDNEDVAETADDGELAT